MEQDDLKFNPNDYEDGYFDADGNFVKYADMAKQNSYDNANPMKDERNDTYQKVSGKYSDVEGVFDEDRYEREQRRASFPEGTKPGLEISFNGSAVDSGSFGVKFLLAWILGSIGLLLFLALVRINDNLLIIDFGQLFLGSGILMAWPKKKGALATANNIGVGLLFGIVGAGILWYGLSKVFGENGIFGNAENMLPKMAAGFLAIVGVWLVANTLFTMWYQKRKMTYSVIGTVVAIASHRSSSSSGSTRMYAPIWEFEYKGQRIRQKDSSYTSHCPFQVGARAEIKINPDNPDEISSGTEMKLAPIALGIIFASFGIVVFL